MELKRTNLVYGYARANQQQFVFDAIIDIIYAYYTLLPSNILTDKEQISFIDFLLNRLNFLHLICLQLALANSC